MPDTFDHDIHTVQVKYPSDPSVQMGGGYQFASRTPHPYQREFVLSFDAMIFYMSGGSKNLSDTPTSTYNPKLNWWRLELFYKNNGTWKTFIYPHPAEGNINVRFKQPLEQPKVVKGGHGVSEAFELIFVEQP